MPPCPRRSCSSYFPRCLCGCVLIVVSSSLRSFQGNESPGLTAMTRPTFLKSTPMRGTRTESGMLVLQSAGIARCTRANVKCRHLLDVVVNLYHAIRYLGIWVDLSGKCLVGRCCHIVKQSAAVAPE